MYDDQPFWVLYENAMEQYYGNSPLGHRVLGTNQTINEMNRNELAGYFEQRYSADNTIIAIAGRVDFDNIVAQIELHCRQWQRTGATRTYENIQRHSGKFQKNIEDLHQHYLMMMMPSASFQDERKHAVGALASIFGGGDGSRLHWALVDSGLAEAAAASADTSDQFGEQLAWSVCDPRHAEQVSDTIRSEMKSLASSLVEDDLAKVVAKAGTAAAVGSERPSGRMKRLGSMLTTSGSYTSLEDELHAIETLTLKDLQEAAEAFPWEPLFEASTLHT